MRPLLLALPLVLVACGGRTEPAAAPGPQPAASDSLPGEGLGASAAGRTTPSSRRSDVHPSPEDPHPSALPSTPAAEPPAPAEPPVPPGPIDDRFATTRDGWRVDYHLRLPALPGDAQRRMRRACIAWLFQGQAQPRPTVAESGEAALATLIADGGRTGEGDPWYVERAVVATHQGGGWLALRRSERSFAGGAHPTARVEGLIVELDGVRALTVDEIVPPDRQAGLRLRLAAIIRRERGLGKDGPLTSEVANDAELPLPIPLLTPEGARFVWNPYEIGPFSDGAYEAALPAAEAKEFLAADPWR